MSYTPLPQPFNLSLPSIASWVAQEFLLISEAFSQPTILDLAQSNVEPERPRDGMIVYADGTNWNPGSGEGYYGYYNSTWNKLG